jgi:hypothetical protein
VVLQHLTPDRLTTRRLHRHGTTRAAVQHCQLAGALVSLICN